MRTMGDSAWPPSAYPRVDAWAFYIGGNTPHIWSDAEIAAVPCRWRLPIFTRSNPSGAAQGAAEGARAASWMRARRAPAGCAVALDYEGAVNGAYVTAFDAAVTAAGWRTLLYGSLSSVTRNPRPSAGYWTASWTGSAHLDGGAAATQWASDTMLGEPYDLSEVADTLVLWDTGAPAPEDDMTPDQANTLEQISNAVFFGGTSTGETPPGAPDNSIVHKLDYLMGAVRAIQAPTVDPAAVAAALAADAAFVQAIAHAIAVELHDITPSS